MSSLRRALAQRFVFTMLVGLSVLGLWFFWGAHRAVDRDFDRGLNATLNMVSAGLRAGLPIVRYEPWPEDTDRFIRDVNRFVTVRDPTGRVVAGNTPLSTAMPLHAVGFERARAGEWVFVNEHWDDMRVRSIYAPAPAGVPADWSIIQVSASLSDVQGAFDAAFWLVAVTLIVAGVATARGAGWLADSIVAPVRTITRQADGITPGTLGQRITAHANLDEYRDLVRVLNEMLERLDHAISAQRRIIADTGHDIRTPLTAMLGQIEVLLRSDRSVEQYRAGLESCLEDVNQLTDISESLMLLARLDAGQVQPTLGPTELRDLVERAVKKHNAEPNHEDYPIRTVIEDSATAVLDTDMVSMALDHLIGNAKQHTPPGTLVQITAASTPRHAELCVEDAGPGMPDEQLPLLFQRLYRGDDARQRHGGAGLGLTITEAIIRAHGGTIDAARSDLGGLLVRMRIPHRPAHPAPGAPSSLNASIGKATVPSTVGL